MPQARIPVLVRVAWRDGPDQPWRYGTTEESLRPVDGPEVVVVFEYDTGDSITFTGDEIERLHPKPIVRGSGGRSTKRIG